MKVLFDTDVLLDILLKRLPHFADSARALVSVERAQHQGWISAASVTTLYYLGTKTVGAGTAKKGIQRLLSLLEIAPVNRVVLDGALTSRMADFEDAVISESAYHAGLEAILTRNTEDFAHSKLPAYTPRQFNPPAQHQGPGKPKA